MFTLTHGFSFAGSKDSPANGTSSTITELMSGS